MCLISFAWCTDSRHRLRMFANRDEFYARPTDKAAWWSDHQDIFAGRDLQSGGTWLGVSQQGKVAAVTNVREPGVVPGPVSRGALITDYLTSQLSPEAYATEVLEKGEDYSGFNLLLFDASSAVYCSNRVKKLKKLTPGVYGLSNASLDTPWPKLLATREALAQSLSESAPLEAMKNHAIYSDEQLPQTGVSIDTERMLSSAFIVSEHYGTRAITQLKWRTEGEVSLTETSFHCGELFAEVTESIQMR